MKNIRTLTSVLALSAVFGVMAPLKAHALIVYGTDGAPGTESSPNGENGGKAYAVQTSFDTSVVAYAGRGGSGYNPGVYGAQGGEGGNGGVAYGELSFSATSDLEATVQSVGGEGGSGYGVAFTGGTYGGVPSGNGGEATALIAIKGGDHNLKLTAKQTGGAGGEGYGGAAGGNGADSLMDNNVIGGTSGTLTLVQEAKGGAGGWGNGHANGTGSSAGTAGNASAIFDVKDKQASVLTLQNKATGGAGGSVIGGGRGTTKGGDATAKITMTATGSGVISALSYGGAGGSVQSMSTGAGASGGNAYASFEGSVYSTLQKAALNADGIKAYGGAGGKGVFGDGGDGGSAMAFVDATVFDPSYYSSYSKTGRSTVDLLASGGVGGSATGPASKGGNGGEAEAKGTILLDGTYTGSYLLATVTQSGGAGGAGFDTANGGDGADSIIDNAVEIGTYGKLFFKQTANGGDGGGSATGIGGDAGDAVSIASVDKGSAYQLALESYANGGTGGSSGSGPSKDGGDAFASALGKSMNSGAKIDIKSFATGGVGVKDASYGTAEAIALGEGYGWATVQAASVAKGSQSTASALSTIKDMSGNTLSTSASSHAEGGIQVGARTKAIAGWTNYESVTMGSGYSWSTGNITRTSYPEQTTAALGTATGDFVIIGDGRMGAQHSDTIGSTETYLTSASFLFDGLETGKALLFSLTNTSTYGRPDDGIDSITFTLSQDSNPLFSGTYASVADWATALSSPLNLGAISGTTMLTVSMAQVISADNEGLMFDYMFAVADLKTLGGTYQTVSNVPLPAAAPLFAVAVFGLGALGRRRSIKK